MFIRQALLLVCDDLSSALDVDAKQRMWERPFARQDATYLVVSHRRPLLRHANQIVMLKSGRVEDTGRLEPLLERRPERRSLWEGRAADEDKYALRCAEKKGHLIDERQHEHDAVESVEESTVAGQEDAAVFDSDLAFEHADGQIAEKRENSASQTYESAKPDRKLKR